MKKGNFIYIFFIAVALLMSGGLIYIEYFQGEPSDAASFGISPPYLKFDDLRPGNTFSQDIRVLRGESGGEQMVTARFDDLEIADWIEIGPSESIILESGQKSSHFNFRITVPHDAVIDRYQGGLYFAISSPNPGRGVSLSLGARAEVDIKVVAGLDKATSLVKFSSRQTLDDNTLAERLQGRFIMRTEAKGELYYLHPNEKWIYYLSTARDFQNILESIGRGINNELLNKIDLDFAGINGLDSDQDGLPDLWETALGTDIKDEDTDNDGYNDLEELKTGFSPLGENLALSYDRSLADSLSGYLLLQVDNRGQAWYVNPIGNKRTLLASFDDSLLDIQGLALGISEENYQKLVK